MVPIHFGIQPGAAHIVFHTILTIGHTITDMVLMARHITIILITSTIIGLHRDTEIQQDIIPEIIMVEEDQQEQGTMQVLQDDFTNLQELLLLTLPDQQLPQEAEHTQIAETDREVEVQ